MADKAHHVLYQLPEHRHPIRARMLINLEFRSLCEDYGDASDALCRWEDSADSHRAARVEEFHRLLGELKTEILAELEAK